jgi:hypothetical protein
VKRQIELLSRIALHGPRPNPIQAKPRGARILVAELLEQHREQLHELFRLTPDLIKDAFQARKIFLVRGAVVAGGPDHYARLEAAKLFLRLISSRR